eukprot:Sro145_g067370.1 Hemolysin-type calcium-binding repeat (2 copies) (1021) ;mRNA; r:75230-78627
MKKSSNRSNKTKIKTGGASEVHVDANDYGSVLSYSAPSDDDDDVYVEHTLDQLRGPHRMSRDSAHLHQAEEASVDSFCDNDVSFAAEDENPTLIQITTGTTLSADNDDDTLACRLGQSSSGPKDSAAPMDEVDLDGKKVVNQKRSRHSIDEENNGSDQENDSQLSDSCRDEDETSSADTAEAKEQQVRQSLFFAILSACGLLFCMKLMTRLVNRCTERGNDDVPGVDEAAEEAAVEVGNQAASAGRTGLLAQQQSMTNLLNPTVWALQGTTQQMAAAAAQGAASATAAGTTAATGGISGVAAATVAGSSMTAQIGMAIGVAGFIAVAAAVAAPQFLSTGTASSTGSTGGYDPYAAYGNRFTPFPTPAPAEVPVAATTTTTTTSNQVAETTNLDAVAAIEAIEDDASMTNDTNATFLFNTTRNNVTSNETSHTGAAAFPMEVECEATEDVVEQKEGLVDFVIVGLPLNFTTQEQEQLEAIFQLTYNGLAGMCSGDYQRILQNVTLQEVNYVAAGRNLIFTYTKWACHLTCLGCPDDNPLFGMPNDISQVTAMSRSGGRELQSSAGLFSNFVNAFMFEMRRTYPSLEESEESSNVRLYSGAVLNPIDPQVVVMEYTGDGKDREPVAEVATKTFAPSDAKPNPTSSPSTAIPSTGTPTVTAGAPSAAPTTSSPTTSPPTTSVPTQPVSSPRLTNEPESIAPTTLSPTVKPGQPSAVPTTSAPTSGLPTEEPISVQGDNNAQGADGSNQGGKNPTLEPTRRPTLEPTQRPTLEPTRRPTLNPTQAPTREPTRGPTRAPSKGPTRGPTNEPTNSPTRRPTQKPTSAPTPGPTNAPTKHPTPRPTNIPTQKPTQRPTAAPTSRPTPVPTKQPTPRPTNMPTLKPTRQPTSAPTSRPPTRRPTPNPVPAPTSRPPTRRPTPNPVPAPTSRSPSRRPTPNPVPAPTSRPPTRRPTPNPVPAPTSRPPSRRPTPNPVPAPTSRPPTRRPTPNPVPAPTSRRPTGRPTNNPTSSLVADHQLNLLQDKLLQ